MFLNLKLCITLTLTFVSLAAPAQSIIFLTPGQYDVVTKEEPLCYSFSMSEKETQARHVSFGRLYDFEVRNSVVSIESDIDPTCEFKEQNRRENLEDKTVLTRINEEYCKGKLRSRTVSTASISDTEISVRHEIDKAEPYTCIWKKQ